MSDVATNMKVVNVYDTFKITQISKYNHDIWPKMRELVEAENAPVIFDFEEVELVEPWNNEEFKQFFSNPNVRMRVYSSEKLRDTINLMCMFGNMPEGRVENVDEVVYEGPTVMDKQQNAFVQRLKQHFFVEKGVAVLNICDIIDQIGSGSTVEALESAIQEYHNDTGVNDFVVNVESIFIQINIIEKLADIIGKFLSKGISLIINSDDADTAGKISIYQCVAGTNRLNPEDKVEIFKDLIPMNAVGMLTQYKKTKGKDEFGRCGNGRPLSCRPAIFKGFIQNDEGHFAIFTVFNGNTFMTRMDYENDHDGESHPGLQITKQKINIDEIGLCDKFMGSLFHFTLPIQYRPEDTTTSYHVADDGSVEIREKKLPEFIKDVLDDFDIPYDEMTLIHSIGETTRFLAKYKKETESDI